MKLTYEDILGITFGVETITAENDFFDFKRFSLQGIELYKNLRNYMFNRTLSTAGVRLSFITNSRTMEFDYKIPINVYFDVYENGSLIEHLGKKSEDSEIDHICLNFSDGEKHIEIYCPYLGRFLIANVTIDDDCFANPVKRAKTMICYGDSITAGHCASYPSLSYANMIANLFDADIINKAVSGDYFFPELLDSDIEPNADIVTVAYGTNDWNKCSYDELSSNCKSFFEKIYNIYTNSKIFAITPLWRADGDKKTNAGILCSELDGVIRDICKSYNRINVINGQHLTPHNKEFYLDKCLHPNDLGFGVYVSNLYKEMLKFM